MSGQKKQFSIKRLICVFVGVFLIGAGSGLFRIAGMGNDPYGCMNLGISGQTGFSFGSVQLAVNIILLIPMLICFRKGLGIGTVVNMVGCGYVSDFVVWFLRFFHLTADGIADSLFARILVLFIGVVLLCFGVAFYMECQLGIAPYDALGEMLPIWTRGKLKFFLARVITDVICVAVGFFLGSIVGVGTLITAFFTGPLTSFFRERVAKPFLGE